MNGSALYILVGLLCIGFAVYLLYTQFKSEKVKPIASISRDELREQIDPIRKKYNERQRNRKTR